MKVRGGDTAAVALYVGRSFAVALVPRVACCLSKVVFSLF
jgi:hypothetical protein